MAFGMSADEAEVAEAIRSADLLLAEGRRVDMAGLEAWWRANRANLCKWAKRIQRFPFSVIGFVQRLGQLAQKLVTLVDSFFGIDAAPCD